MKFETLRTPVLPALLLGISAASAGAATIVESSTAPASPAIGQPDFSAPAFDGAKDFSDNAGPPGQTFTTVGAFSLSAVTVKGFANTGASFGNFDASSTWTITISQVSGTALTSLDQETTAAFTPTNGADYLTFTLGTPVALSAGTQYAYDIFTASGYFGFAKSAADVYAGGAAIEHGSTSRTSASGAQITNTQTVDRTFFAQSVPESGTWVAFAGGLGILVALRRRRS